MKRETHPPANADREDDNASGADDLSHSQRKAARISLTILRNTLALPRAVYVTRMNARNAGPSPALRIIAALIGALVAGVIGWLAHDATFGAAFASATALVVSVFAGDLWILTPSYKRDRQAALDARSALVQAIRDAEATKERGWLIRFSCFPTGTTADAFIPYFEAASNFDPEQYLQAIEALDRAMESRYKEDRLRDAKNFARVEWQAEAARNHHPSI